MGKLPPVVSFVGKSNSGKTTLVVKVIEHLSAKGMKIFAIKHAPHGYTSSPANVDSSRLKKAGAAVAAVHGPSSVELEADLPDDSKLHQILERFVTDEDLVICEGYKTASVPKIEISRADRSTELICPNDPELIAVVADYPVNCSVPVFKLTDTAQIADFIAERFCLKV